jgi:monovalent cation:H+ antiporter-2, CPA2 family
MPPAPPEAGFSFLGISLSPIIGYMVAGIFLGRHTAGYIANYDIASELAEIGVILLMFGVGLQFDLKELLAVRAVAIPGALVQIALAPALGAATAHGFGWDWGAEILFGLSISVASTVVLTRILSDNNALHTRPDISQSAGWWSKTFSQFLSWFPFLPSRAKEDNVSTPPFCRSVAQSAKLPS